MICVIKYLSIFFKQTGQYQNVDKNKESNLKKSDGERAFSESHLRTVKNMMTNIKKKEIEKKESVIRKRRNY